MYSVECGMRNAWGKATVPCVAVCHADASQPTSIASYEAHHIIFVECRVSEINVMHSDLMRT